MLTEATLDEKKANDFQVPAKIAIVGSWYVYVSRFWMSLVILVILGSGMYTYLDSGCLWLF
jgi:hypothetical protein